MASLLRCRVRRATTAWRIVGWCAAVAATPAALPTPALAVVTAGDPAAVAAASRPEGWPTPDLSAVARLSNGCSAVLLTGGRHLLGAAHCAAGSGTAAVLASGERVVILALATAPQWSGRPGVHDLAVMTLATPATTAGLKLATLSQVESAGAVLVAGYGAGGTPGAPQPPGTLRHGYNEYDAAFTPPGWGGIPPVPPIRLFDFDDGSLGANTLGLRPGGRSSLGFGPAEAMLAAMDSGGPSLLAVQRPVTGLLARWMGAPAAWHWRIAAIHVGVDGARGSAPGGLGMDQLVGPWVPWIASVTGLDAAALTDTDGDTR